jgi:hypothetical protein
MSSYYNTGNEIGSSDVRDLSDDARAFDQFTNSNEDTFTDRFGVERKTISGATRSVGIPIIGNFTTGCTVTDYNQGVQEVGGSVYRWKGALPKTVPPSSTPAGTGGISPSGDWVDVGDASVYQRVFSDLSGGNGASLIGYGDETVAAAIDKLVSDGKAILASNYATPNNPNESQHAKLQEAWDLAASQGKIFVVDGVFWILPNNRTYPDGLTRPVGLQVPNNSRALWLSGAAIKSIPSSLPLAYVINCYLADNFEIINPVVYGDVDDHTGVTDESYHCLNVVNCTNGYIHRPRAFNAWGDGIYIGTEYSAMTNRQIENVTIFEPYVEHCGRNCISVTSGRNIRIVRPTVQDAFRTAPKAGIDIEPEGAGLTQPLLDGVSIDGPIYTRNCYYGVGIYTFPALQGCVKVSVGDIFASNCFQPIQALNFSQNAGSITVGDVHVDTCDISPIGIKWSQYQLWLKIGKLFAHNACSGVPTTERYKSLVSVDIDSPSQPSANIGYFEIGDMHITNSGVNNVLCPLYFKDNTIAANRVLDTAKIGDIYGATVNKYFYADGKVTKNFKFKQLYESSFYLTQRRPCLYSEVRISASGFDFEVRMGSDYDTDLKITKSDLTSAPVKVYPRSGGTFYPLSNSGAGYINTSVPGSSVSLTIKDGVPHFFQSDITGSWTAP